MENYLDDLIIVTHADDCYLVSAPAFQANVGDVVDFEADGSLLTGKAALVSHFLREDAAERDLAISTYGFPVRQALALYRKCWCAE